MKDEVIKKSKVRLYLDLAKEETVRPSIEKDVAQIRHYPACIRSGDPEIDSLSMKESDVWSSAQKWLAQKKPLLKRIICEEWDYCSRRRDYGEDYARLARDVAEQIDGVVGERLSDIVAAILFKESLFSLCECGDVKNLMREAVDAYQRKQYDDRTYSLFAHITEIDPDNHRAHYYQGSIKLKQHRYEEAKPHYLKAMALNPTDGVYLNDLAYIYGTCGDDLEIAQDYAALALKMFSDDPVNRPASLDTLGTVLTQRKKYKEALPYLAEALELVRKDVESIGVETLQEVLYHVAVVYKGIGDEKLFKETASQIQSLNPHSHWAEKVNNL